MSNILYSAVPLDRAHHIRRDAQALEAARANPAKLVVPFWREMSLIDTVHAQHPAVLGHGVQAAELMDLAREIIFLGIDTAGVPFFAADISDVEAEADGTAPNLGLGGNWLALRGVGGLMPPGQAGLLGYARAVLIWHRRARFCGSCGAPTESKEGGHARQCLDPHCGAETYPRTDPAVIMRVTDDDSILLHRQKAWPQGQWSVLAGFVEPGETLEEAVAREVHEETGIRVADIVYAGSQPWPFPSSAMIAFAARAVGGELKPDPQELEDARWFTRAQIRAEFDERHRSKGTGLFLPTPGSIAWHLIQDWLAAG
jgi:NAD+ diphosphatase